MTLPVCGLYMVALKLVCKCHHLILYGTQVCRLRHKDER
jgi:hypothetical protein